MNIRLALRYLGERKLRTALTTLAIVLGVTLIFGLNSMLPAMQAAFRQNLMATADLTDLTVTSAARGDTIGLPSAAGQAQFEVVGIMTRRPTPGAEEIYIPLASAQQLLNLTGLINTAAWEAPTECLLQHSFTSPAGIGRPSPNFSGIRRGVGFGER